MYLLQKYDALSGLDHAEFISKDVPPWHISDDTCGPQPEPPVTRRCEDCKRFHKKIHREIEHWSSDSRVTVEKPKS